MKSTTGIPPKVSDHESVKALTLPNLLVKPTIFSRLGKQLGFLRILKTFNFQSGVSNGGKGTDDTRCIEDDTSDESEPGEEFTQVGRARRVLKTKNADHRIDYGLEGLGDERERFEIMVVKSGNDVDQNLLRQVEELHIRLSHGFGVLHPL